MYSGPRRGGYSRNSGQGGGRNDQYNGGYNSGGYNRNPPPKPPPDMIVKRDNYSGFPMKCATNDEVNIFRNKESIVVRGSGVPPPFLEFSDYAWPRYIVEGLAQQGYERPTPIQAQGWPIALHGRDMVGIAQTGSGKTLSYILPAFVHIDSQLNERRGTPF